MGRRRGEDERRGGKRRVKDGKGGYRMGNEGRGERRGEERGWERRGWGGKEERMRGERRDKGEI